MENGSLSSWQRKERRFSGIIVLLFVRGGCLSSALRKSAPKILKFPLITELKRTFPAGKR